MGKFSVVFVRLVGKAFFLFFLSFLLFLHFFSGLGFGGCDMDLCLIFCPEEREKARHIWEKKTDIPCESSSLGDKVLIEDIPDDDNDNGSEFLAAEFENKLNITANENNPKDKTAELGNVSKIEAAYFVSELALFLADEKFNSRFTKVVFIIFKKYYFF